MTWGIYKKHRELRGGGIFVKGYDSVISKFGGGAPRQNYGSNLRYNKMIPRLDDSDTESEF